MIDWNGFDKGVIGRKLPSDSTLNNMKKSELIELLHYAEHNHKVLAEAYQIAVDNSKCNICPLSLNSKKVRADAIEELLKSICIGCAYLNGTKCESKLGCPCSISRDKVIREAKKVLNS